MGKLCFLCCFSIGSSPNSEESLPSNENFKLFCEQLEEIGDGGAGNHFYESEGQEMFIATSLFALLNSTPCKDKLSVCSDCLKLITTTMKVKGVMMRTEERVRGLQNQILKLLRELEGHAQEFSKGMKKIENNVKGSDKDCLHAYIAKEGGKSKSWMKRDIELFRGRIMEVSQSTNLYRERLEEATLTRQRPVINRPSSMPPPTQRNPSNSMNSTHQKGEMDSVLLPVKTEITSEENQTSPSASDTLMDFYDDNFEPNGDDDPLEMKLNPITREEEANFVEGESSSASDNSDDNDYRPSGSKRQKMGRKQGPASSKASTSISIKGSKVMSFPHRQPPLEFVLTSRGNHCVILGNYLYYMNDNSYNPKDPSKKYYYLRCSEKQAGCKSRIVISGYQKKDNSYKGYTLSSAHTGHPPPLDKIEKFRSRDLATIEQRKKMKAQREAQRKPRQKPTKVTKTVDDEPLKFLASSRGKPSLLLGGFLYYRNNATKTTVHFVCSDKYGRRCKAYVTVLGLREDEIVDYTEPNAEDNRPYISYTMGWEHCHPVHTKRILRLKAQMRAKELVASSLGTDTTTATICKQVEQDLAATLYLPVAEGDGNHSGDDKGENDKDAVLGLELGKIPSFRRLVRSMKKKQRDKMLICFLCGAGFATEELLEEHEKTHDGGQEGQNPQAQYSGGGW